MLTQADKVARARMIFSATEDLEKQGHMLEAFPSVLMRANLSDAEAALYKDVYPEFEVGVEYKKDWIISYEGNLYRIGQNHTSSSAWMPGEDGTTALYSLISYDDEGYEVWKAWDGVSGSYAKDQIVRDPTDDNLYISKIDSNVWGPPNEQPSYWDPYISESE